MPDQVAPLPASLARPALPTSPSSSHSRRSVSALASRAYTLGFSQVFGRLGLPLLAVALVCVAWTTWLIVLTLAPNETANALMDTGGFDDGQFWLIVDTDPGVKYSAVAGLALIDGYYAYIVLKMTVWRRESVSLLERVERKLLQWKRQRQEQHSPRSASYARSHQQQPQHRWKELLVAGYCWVAAFWKEFTGITGRYRKLWNAVLKLVDLAVQSLQLHEILEAGFPDVMVRGYAVFLASNSLSCAVTILLSRHSAMSEILIDTIFDLIAAVGYPIAVLVYSYVNFDFDRAAFQVNVDVLPPGSFELLARAAADPAEIAFFLACFDSLRFLTPGNLALRLGMNLAFCNRFRAIVESLVCQQRQAARVKRNAVATAGPPRLAVPTSEATPATSTPATATPASQQRPVPKLAAAVFVAFAALAVAASETAMAASHAVCGDYPQCVVFAHRVRLNGLSSCPCLTLIDVDRSPRIYTEWMNPVDLTDVVTDLAKSGDLRVLQLVNRGLPRWPDALRGCRQLHCISLIYTGLEAIPSWAKELKLLEYLHIEGKELFPNLQHLDPELFSDMPHLTFLHLAVHDKLRALPPLSGVPNLRSAVFAHMFSLERVPSLERVRSLQRLELPYLPVLQAIPDLTPLRHLVHFVVYRRSNLCCNGFMGKCDLDNAACTANTALGIPAAICMEGPNAPRATAGTLATVQAFSFAVCQDSPFDQANSTDALSFDTTAPCGGVPFRQCELPVNFESSGVGICYNNRMQVLSCVTNPDIIRLRQAQIAGAVGLPCNITEEAWFGCR